MTDVIELLRAANPVPTVDGYPDDEVADRAWAAATAPQRPRVLVVAAAAAVIAGLAAVAVLVGPQSGRTPAGTGTSADPGPPLDVHVTVSCHAVRPDLTQAQLDREFDVVSDRLLAVGINVGGTLSDDGYVDVTVLDGQQAKVAAACRASDVSIRPVIASADRGGAARALAFAAPKSAAAFRALPAGQRSKVRGWLAGADCRHPADGVVCAGTRAYLLGAPVADGTDVDMSAVRGPGDGGVTEWGVQVMFSDAAAAAVRDAGSTALVVDGTAFDLPAPDANGVATVTGGFDTDAATHLADDVMSAAVRLQPGS